ncbi:hypothetical protein FGB62_204g13 [Gracilaria domingensis]|nr:hypothetical protein FGB62_204g13 [Gracilaria domingensis]
MVLFTSATPTLSPSASMPDLVAPFSTVEFVSDAPTSSETVFSSTSPMDERIVSSPLQSIDISTNPSVDSVDTFGNMSASPIVSLEMSASTIPSGSSEGTSITPSPSQPAIQSALATMVLFVSSSPTPSPLVLSTKFAASDVLEMVSEAPAVSILPSETPVVTPASMSDSLDTGNPTPSASRLLLPGTSATSLPSPSPSTRELMAPSDAMEVISEAPSATALFSEIPFVSSGIPSDSVEMSTLTPSASTLVSPAPASTVVLISFSPVPSPLSSRTELTVAAPSNAMDIIPEEPSDATVTPFLFSVSPVDETDVPSSVQSAEISMSPFMNTFTPSASQLSIAVTPSTMDLTASSLPTPSLSPSVSKRDLVMPSDVMETTSEAPRTTVVSSETPSGSSLNLMDSLETDTADPSTSERPIPVASDQMVPLVSSTPTLSLSPSASKRDLVVPSNAMDTTPEVPGTIALPSEIALMSSPKLLDELDIDSPAPTAGRLPVPFVSSTPTLSLSSSESETQVVVPSSTMEMMSEALRTSVSPLETPLMPSANLMDVLDTRSPAPSVSRIPVPGASATFVPLVSSTPTLSPSGSKTVLVVPSEDAEPIEGKPTSTLGTPVSSEMPVPMISFAPMPSPEPLESPGPTTANAPSASEVVSDTPAKESQLPITATLPAQSSLPLSEMAVSSTPIPPSPTYASDSEDIPAATLSLAPAGPSRARPMLSVSNVLATPSFSPSHGTLSPSFIPATPVASALVTPLASTAESDEVIPDDMQLVTSSLAMSLPSVTDTAEFKTENSPEPREVDVDDSSVPQSGTPEMTATVRAMEASPSVTSDASPPEASPMVTPRAIELSISNSVTPSVTPSGVKSSAAASSSSEAPSLGLTTPSLSVSAIPRMTSTSASPEITSFPSFISAPPLPSVLVTPLATSPSNSELPDDTQSSTVSFDVDPLSTEILEPDDTSSSETDELQPEDPRFTASFDSDVTPAKTSAATSDLISPEASQSVTPRPSPSRNTRTSGLISTTAPRSSIVTPMPTIEIGSIADVLASMPGNDGRGEVSASLSSSLNAPLNALSPEATPVSALLLLSPTITPEVAWPERPETSVMVTVSPSNLLPTPTSEFSGEPTPTVVASVMLWTPSPDPNMVNPCSNLPVVVPDSSLLAQTANFQRVRLRLQVAGPNMMSTCQLKDDIVQRFVNLSAMSTLSNAHLWFITSVEDGPAVFTNGSTLVVVEEEVDVMESTAPQHSADPEDMEEVFPGSVVIGVTAFMSPFSVELMQAAYIQYVRSQNIVRALRQKGFDEIHWTGIAAEPVVVDKRKAPMVEVSSGVSGGYIAGIAFGTLLIVGAAVLIVAETGRPT